MQPKQTALSEANQRVVDLDVYKGENSVIKSGVM
jgi:hypothetical protein